MDRVEGYNFDLKFIFIRIHMKKLYIIFNIEFLDRFVLTDEIQN